MKRLFLPAAFVLASFVAPAHSASCGEPSMATFRDAYVVDRSPAIIGNYWAGEVVTRTLDQMRDDQDTLDAWKAASPAKRKAFLDEVKSYANTVASHVERELRKGASAAPGFVALTPEDCIPSALRKKYPKITQLLRVHQEALPLAVGWAVDGLAVSLQDDTPAKVAARTEANAKELGYWPVFPFSVPEHKDYAVLAVAGFNSKTPVAADPSQTREWFAKWKELASPDDTFHASDEEDAVLTAVRKNEEAFFRAFFKPKVADMSMAINKKIGWMTYELRK